MIKVIYLISSFFLSSFLSAQNRFENLFLELPLDSSREQIYDAIKKREFTKEKGYSTLTNNGKIIPTYFGSLNTEYKNLINKKADSIDIQLSKGSISAPEENTYNDLLIFCSYYHFSNKKHADSFFKKKKEEIKTITNKEPYHYDNYLENDKNGYGEKWLDLNNKHLDLGLIITKNKTTYTIQIEYSRYEGSKKLKEQMEISQKELIEYEIDTDSIYTFRNVQNIPTINKCSSDLNKDDLRECVEKNIKKYITRKFDMSIAEKNLNSGKHTIFAKFIIDKIGRTVNIRVHSKNEKVSNHLKKVINSLPKMIPANHNGKKVNTAYGFPLIFRIDDK